MSSPQAEFRTGPPSPVSHWPLKLSCTLAPQAQFRIGPSSSVAHWPHKPSII